MPSNFSISQVFFWLVFSKTIVFTQNLIDSSKKDSILVARVLQFSEKLNSSGKFEEALAEISKAKTILDAKNDSSLVMAKVLEMEANLLNSLGKPAVALPLIDRNIQILQKLRGDSSLEMGQAFYEKAMVLMNLRKIQESKNLIQKAIVLREFFEDEKMEAMVGFYRDVGSVFLAAFEYQTALDYFQKSVEGFSSLQKYESPEVCWNLSDIARCHFYLGNFQSAHRVSAENLRVRNRVFQPNAYELATAYNLHGAIMQTKENYVEAILNYEKAIEVAQINGKGGSRLVVGVFGNLTECYSVLENFEQAMFCAKKAEALQIQLNDQNFWRFIFIKQHQANVLSRQKNYRAALDCLIPLTDSLLKLKPMDSLQTARFFYDLSVFYYRMGKKDSSEICLSVCRFQTLKNNHPTLKAYILNSLGEVDLKKDDFDACQKNYENAAATLGFSTENQFKKVYELATLQEIFRNQSQIFYNYFKERNSKFLISKSTESAQKGFEVLRLRTQNDFQTDKGFKFGLDAHLICEALVRGLFETFEAHDPAFFEQIFEILEQSKTIQLTQKIAEMQALKFASIPDNLLEKEIEIRQKITQLEKQKHKLIQEGKKEDSPEYLAQAAKIFDATEQWNALKTKFEEDYPNYYKLKYDRTQITLEKAQQALQPNQTALEYFDGEEAVFLLAYNRDSARLVKIEKDFPLEKWVADLRHSLTAGRATEAAQFAEIAHALYQKLVAPVADLYGDGDLLVIPDGVLGYLPFEVLLTAKPEKLNRFRDHAYLLRQHNISYALSANLNEQMKNRRHAAEPMGKFIGFAPFFDGDTSTLAALFPFDEAMRKDFQPLVASGEEAVGAAKMMRGEARVGAAATRAEFEKRAPNYQIVHLATHGKADDQTGDYAFLAFSKPVDSTSHDLVFVRDLYNFSLNADLVVLSACETGIGKLRRGEGIISLARAFVYAGAKSIVTSLWEVNDVKSKDLMLLFYRNLKKGMRKDEALRRAKLQFIEKQDGVGAHPFFWSGFIQLGDTAGMRN